MQKKKSNKIIITPHIYFCSKLCNPITRITAKRKVTPIDIFCIRLPQKKLARLENLFVHDLLQKKKILMVAVFYTRLPQKKITTFDNFFVYELPWKKITQVTWKGRPTQNAHLWATTALVSRCEALGTLQVVGVM